MGHLNLNRFVYTFLGLTNVMLICMVTLLTGYIHDRMIFDIDKIRKTYMTEMRMIYGRGCEKGMEYPESYRVSSDTFNPNSPTAWCADQGKSLEEYLLDQAWKLGR